jgi:PAS domain S-box-containing protein
VFKDISEIKSLEESLRESERKLATLISNLPGMAYRCLNDENWTMEFISEGCHELTGFKASDLIGNRTLAYNELIHPDDRRLVWDTIQEALIRRESFRIVYRIQTKTEEEKWVWEQGRGVVSEEGTIPVLEGFITEITDRKRLEEDLKVSESKYRRIFEGSKDMIFVSSKDGRIRDVNQAGMDLLGYSKEELLKQKSMEEIYDNPIHWKVFREQIDRQGFVKDFEAPFKKKDGTRMHCLLVGNAVKNADGEFVGYEGIAKDITARMDAIRSLGQRHRELSLLNSVALSMNMTQDLDDILMTALKSVLEVLRLPSGGIFLIDHEKPAFLLRVQQGLFEDGMESSTRMYLHDEALMHSLLSEELYLTPEPTFPAFKATLKDGHDHFSAELTCFLITAKESASGLLALDVPPRRELSDQDVHLLGSLGNFLGGAIENARLVQTIQHHRGELKGLTARLFHSQELERKRIARELHDEAGQALTGINFALETIDKNVSGDPADIREFIGDIKNQINRTYQEMRRLSHRLHPALLSDLGLEPALEAYLSDISKYSQMKIDFRMVGFEQRLDAELETALYRISQEALTNTLKHAKASRFKLSIIKSYPHVIFRAEDDGIGFDPGEFEEGRHALGLLSMRERAGMLGGLFSLRASEGKGTRIRIEIPLREKVGESQEVT